MRKSRVAPLQRNSKSAGSTLRLPEAWLPHERRGEKSMKSGNESLLINAAVFSNNGTVNINMMIFNAPSSET